jgi:twitching motility protein PilT
MKRIHQFLSYALEQRASDIHFSAEEPVRFRIDGDLVPLQNTTASNEEVQKLLFEILNSDEREKLLKEKNIDKSYFVPEIGQFRVNVFFNRKGIAAVLRSIPVKIPSMESLGLPEVIKKIADKPRGLVLVTGPTGSGKSTTLAAIIDYINSTYPGHILTIEDPIEFVHQSKKCLVNQRDIGNSCNSFQDALKYALREDPDVILIGELRDLETISLALTAAETGHLVLGTLHTRGAAASIDRMIDSFPTDQQPMVRAMISDSLLAVISQALVKRADGKGRAAAYEIMVVNHAIANLIREGKVFQMEGVIQTGKKDGMILMEQHLLSLISDGVITREEASPYLKNGGSDHGSSPGSEKTVPLKPAAVPKSFQSPQAPQTPQTPVPTKTLSSPPPVKPLASPSLVKSEPDTLQDLLDPEEGEDQLIFSSTPVELSEEEVPKEGLKKAPPSAPPPLKKKAG